MNINHTFDLFILGGGINGAGVARDASGRGISVMLCEKDDLAQGTSSRTTKFIHGGLRYLEQFEFSLVRKALIEREVILNIAPHISFPLRLIFINNNKIRNPLVIRTGLFLYDHLGGRRLIPSTDKVDLISSPEGFEIKEQYSSGYGYWDVWTDDARMVILNARDAKRNGAEIRTRTEFIGAEPQEDHWIVSIRDKTTGALEKIRARILFDATGPWLKSNSSKFAGLNRPDDLRLVQGSHIILKKWWQGSQAYVLQHTDKRIVFVVPYLDGLAIVGTTERDLEGPIEEASILPSERDYLLDILNSHFTRQFGPDDVISSYSGVRPLFDRDEGKGLSTVTRDYHLNMTMVNDKLPIISAYGGKLTTYRVLAEDVLNILDPFLSNSGNPWTADKPLPGGDIPQGDFNSWYSEFTREHEFLDEPLLRHLGTAYGTDALDILDGVRDKSDLGRCFGGNFYEREALWLSKHEMAKFADDILFRRTKHGLFLSSKEKEDFETWMITNNLTL